MSIDVFWLEQRVNDVPQSDDWLSARERERLHSFKVPKRRLDWRLGRWTAKLAVADWMGDSRDLSRIEIVPDASGAPEVVIADQPVGGRISLSHCDGVAVCAVIERGFLGCDIEIVTARSEAFLADYFTIEEQQAIDGAGKGRARMATLVWSAKESALKAIREGLRRDTRSIAVSRIAIAEPSTWSALTVCCDTGEVFDGWWCESDGLVRTVVAEPSPAVPLPLEIATYLTV
jgi:4'-phosphopantetheinyl transferase